MIQVIDLGGGVPIKAWTDYIEAGDLKTFF